MPFWNLCLLLALIVSYYLYVENTVSIFILDSDNKLDNSWVANRYTQLGFTSSISISDIKFANVTLYTYDAFGCMDSISNSYRINENLKDSVFVSSAFTTNGDHDNELFIPIFNMLPREYEFSIYTRRGQRIFNSTDPKLGWNGRHNNKLVQNGIYTYKLLFNRKSITGTFTVMGEK